MESGSPGRISLVHPQHCPGTSPSATQTFFSTRDSSAESRSALRTAPTVLCLGFQTIQRAIEQLYPTKELPPLLPWTGTPDNPPFPEGLKREKKPRLELPSRSLERGPHPPPFSLSISAPLTAGSKKHFPSEPPPQNKIRTHMGALSPVGRCDGRRQREAAPHTLL